MHSSVRAIAALSVVGAASAFRSSPIYQSYSGWPANCYRQPFLVTVPAAAAAQTTSSLAASEAAAGPDIILAFAEGRNISYCSGTFWPDVPDFPIVVRRSVDGGNSWGETIVITQGNLDFLNAVYDAVSNTVILLIQLGDNGIIQTNSLDAGLTWSTPVNVTVSNQASFPQLASIIPGVGHGLAVDPSYCLDPTCGGTASRLVIPFVCTIAGPVSNDTACGNCRTCLLLSDDSGQSWYMGAVSDQDGSREAALVQLDSSRYATMQGVIYAGERNLGASTGYRWHSISTDGGLTFRTALDGNDTALPDGCTANWTGVVSGYARFDVSPSSSKVIFTAPADLTARQDLSLFVSNDQTGTWVAGESLWPGPAAYSDVIQYNATHAAVVFECGTDEFAQQVNFGWLTAGDFPQ